MQRRRKAPYNALKQRVLQVLADHGGWLSNKHVAIQSGMGWGSGLRGASSYLLRLHRFGLMDRKTISGAGLAHGSRVFYQISERGKKRLAWLASRVPKNRAETGTGKAGRGR